MRRLIFSYFVFCIVARLNIGEIGKEVNGILFLIMVDEGKDFCGVFNFCSSRWVVNIVVEVPIVIGPEEEVEVIVSDLG